MKKYLGEVRIFPDSNGTHTHQLYTGLYDLEKNKIIKLSFNHVTPRWLNNRPTRQFLLIEFNARNGKKSLIAFDLNDGPDIAIPDALMHCDLYLKRSYSKEEINKISLAEKSKIKPFGLNYQVISENQHSLLKRLIIEYASHPFNPIDNNQRPHAVNLYHLLRDHYFPKHNNRQFLKTKEFERPPSAKVEDKVIFQCRLWNPEWFPFPARNSIEEINSMRISLIKNLKREFGSRFSGGLTDNLYTNKTVPELVCHLPTKRKEYIKTMHSHKVAIASSGISNSIGWKMAEYVAASKCIVSEPILYQIPGNFFDGVNYLSFQTPEECISNCYNILDNPVDAQNMEEKNFQYYKKHMKPSSIMYNALTQIFESRTNVTE